MRKKAIGIHDLSKDLEQIVTYLASDKLNGRKQEQKVLKWLQIILKIILIQTLLGLILILISF